MRKLRLIAAFVAVASSAAQSDEIALKNWGAPPFWAPPPSGEAQEPAQARGPAHAARQPLVGGPTALPFISLFPCRLVDTRGNGAPLTGGFLPSATVRSYTLTGICNVPTNAQAISLNATVVKPTGPGFLTLWPEGGAFPPVSTLNYLGGDVIVNAAVVPLSVSGGISIALGVSGGDVVLDTNGYYAPQNGFCIGADCRTSWNGQDASSVTPLPGTCAPGQVPVATGPYQWKCGNICQAAGTADCGGTSCTNIASDPNNCGACAVVCPAVANGTPLCSSSVCGINCNASFINCSGACVNLATDPNHCGSCATACSAGASCVAGACTCPAGTVLCSGICRNLATDPNHCGSCATACSAGASCVAGACTCSAGQVTCGGVCKNLATDPNNCGACGFLCAAGHACVSGNCQ